MTNVLVGIDLGGTSCKIAFLNSEGIIIKKWQIPTIIENNGRQIIPDILSSISEKMSEEGISKESIVGIGMGTPGVVDREYGTVSGAYNLNWVETQEVKAIFSEKFSAPFYLENDANVAALGEKWLGAGDNLKNVVFVTIGTGVGGGIIVNDQLVTGEYGCGGEIGHLHVTDNPNFKCTCGKIGCLESIASATGIVKLAKYLAEERNSNSELIAAINQQRNITSKDIFNFAKNGDAFSIEVVYEFSNYLGIACSHITNILNPSKIVIGGGVAMAGNYLLNEIQKAYEKYVFPKAKDDKTLVLATLLNDAGVVGAAYLAKVGIIYK